MTLRPFCKADLIARQRQGMAWSCKDQIDAADEIERLTRGILLLQKERLAEGERLTRERDESIDAMGDAAPWVEECDRLRAERDEALEELQKMGATANEEEEEGDRLRAELDALQAEVVEWRKCAAKHMETALERDRLRTELEHQRQRALEYGTHDVSCPWWVGRLNSECRCGFQEINK